MDTFPILDKKLPQAALRTASAGVSVPHAEPTSGGAAAAPAMAREALRFPGEDGGKSLSEMAQRDLDATLQLLAERSQYITGASGVAIALRQGANMVCCASAGESAPELGAHLQIDSGLSAESVRTRKTLHCDDAQTDPRVNRESCEALGIASVVVMPLVRGEEVFGVFELLAGRPRAFEDRDFIALQRLSEMIQTAVEHADAAKRAEKFGTGEAALAIQHLEDAVRENGSPKPAGAATVAPSAEVSETKATAPVFTSASANQAPAARTPEAKPFEAKTVVAEESELSAPQSGFPPSGLEGDLEIEQAPILPIALGKVRNCQSCGFPISEGRRLCLDCEASSPNISQENDELFPVGDIPAGQSWMRSNVYLVATVILVVATIAVVMWRI
jgi:putative methionine-R-sulfoxide reductase with GAF domain